ncbi:MAG: hypothetical protein ACRC7R_10780 [Sarcina sp.]
MQKSESIFKNSMFIPQAINSILSIGSYDIAGGDLENGAVKDSVTNGVTLIGGTKNGSSTITVYAPHGGQYELAINYLSGDKNRTLKVDINSYDSGKIYNLDKTLDWNLGNAKTFTLIIDLEYGNNVIKFHGDKVNYSPTLIKANLELIKVTPRVYYLYNGILENDAKSHFSRKNVFDLGGPKDGAVTMPVVVNQSGKYSLNLKYITGLNNLSMIVHVNNVGTGEVYKFQKSTSSAIGAPLNTLNFNVNLNAGLNKIKFHGNGKDYAATLVNFTLNLIEAKEVADAYDLADGVLYEPAKIDTNTNLINNLGGPLDGEVMATVNVVSSGLYNLTLKYLSGDSDRILKVNVNNNDDTGSIFTFKQTLGWGINDINQFNLQLNLIAGINEISFHGDGTNKAPYLGKFTIAKVSTDTSTIPQPVTVPGTITIPQPVTIPQTSTIPTTTTPSKVIYEYDASKGSFSNYAKLDKIANLVSYIGGPYNGTVKVNANIEKSGKYILSIFYRNGGRPLKIDVNDISTGTVYTMGKSYVGVFSTSIDLNSGNNVIKFYGDGRNYAPDLGQFTLSLSEISGSEVQSAIISNLDKAIYENGASWNAAYQLAINIGGLKNGSSTVKVVVNKGGAYNLSILFRYGNRPLKVDINGVNDNNIYTVGSTMAGIFSFIVSLNVGENTIKFYGDGKNPSPELGQFILELIQSSTMSTGSNDQPSYIEYDISKAVLSGKVRVDKLEKVFNFIGGPNNGSVTITVNILTAGVYNLIMVYRNGARSFKIDVNGVNTGQVYTVGRNIMGMFKTQVTLVSGENTIKFYGVDNKVAPDLGRFILVKVPN